MGIRRRGGPVGAWAAIALVALVALVACGDRGGQRSAGAERDGRLKVVTTVAPITSIAANVIGDRADVEGVVPEGADSHTFEPPPSVAEVLSEADVIFLNGLQLEEPTKELALANKRDGAVLVELGNETLDPGEYAYDFSFPREEGRPNPHLWTNPPMARRYAEIVKETMVGQDPENAASYRDNYERFSRLVEQLDRAMRESFATLPPERRKLLTYHDAYAYFAREYGWEVIGAIQVSSFEDPTPKEVADLVEQVEREGVPAIFGSEVFPSAVLEQIGKEAGVRYVDVLRDDDLPGRPGEPEHSWFGLVRFDYTTMVKALGGDASALERSGVGDTAPDRARYPQ
ncbi:MAG: metal ABC transporter substrate-binding protein [Actinomycetota bacterium]|nr:metal ABC transporter substrate-binding protein [Actinomycetota bacterium]